MNPADTHQHHQHPPQLHREPGQAEALQTLMIEGAGCASCVTKIEKALQAVELVRSGLAATIWVGAASRA